MDREEEILKELEELEQEYSNLTIMKMTGGNGYYDYYSDRHYGNERELEQVGSQTEIMNVAGKIQKLKEELEQIRRIKESTKLSNEPEKKFEDKEEVNRILEEQKQEREQKKIEEEREQRKIDEAIRKQTFKKIKKLYKQKGRSFDRIMNLLQGKKPNWSKISRYTQEELDFIIKTKQGDTKYQKRTISGIIEHSNKKNLSFNEQKKLISDSNWREFNRILQDKNRLNLDLEIEERRRR